MKNVIIRNQYIVGMHHGGRKQLEVGTIYYCKPEPTNPVDPKAVAVYEDRNHRRRICYLRREDAWKLHDVLPYAKGPCYLKPKFAAEKFNKYKGPMQNCSIGFKCHESDCDRLEQLLNNSVHRIF
jgi:hypothetical protein